MKSDTPPPAIKVLTTNAERATQMASQASQYAEQSWPKFEKAARDALLL